MANEVIKQQNIELALKAAAQLFLNYGPTNTTKQMIAKKSGLSRRSIERYFDSISDCIVQTGYWLAKHIHSEMFSYNDEIFESGKYTGAQIFKIYLEETKKSFKKEPKLPICYIEMKTYIYRNSDDAQRDYERLADALGIRRLVEKIFKLGAKDGTLRLTTDWVTAAEYFYQMTIYYYSGLTLSYDLNPEKTLENIDDYILNNIQHYCFE